MEQIKFSRLILAFSPLPNIALRDGASNVTLPVLMSNAREQQQQV